MLLAAEGAKVVVNDLGVSVSGEPGESPAEQVVQEITAAGGTVVANFDDVTSWDGSKHLVDQAVETFGDLNILVNNAGFLRDKMSFNMTEEEFDSVTKVHLKGHFCPSRWAAIYWRGRSKAGRDVYARIINTSSEAGLFGNAGQANYSAAKGGIYSMTLVFARELGKIGATANAIAPRGRTRMTETLGGPYAKEAVPTEGFDEWHPDNVAPVVGWLASPAAAGISGQVFVVWGGKVHLLAPFEHVASLVKEGRWTVSELAEAQGKLFGDRPTGVPRFLGSY